MNRFSARLIIGMGLMVLLSNAVNAQWVRTNGPVGTIVYALAVSGNNIFAGTSNGIFLSSNNGATWTAVDTVVPGRHILSLAVNGDMIFAGTFSGVFLSTDNGTHWSAINTGLPAYKVVRALAVSGSAIFAGVHESGIYLSANNGTTWNAVNSGLPKYSFGDTSIYCIVNTIAINSNYIFAGISNDSNNAGGGVYRSSNNGTSWTAVNSGLPNSSGISVCEVDGLAALTNTIYGISEWTNFYQSSNNGANWTKVNTGTITFVQCLAINGGNIFAGTYDSGVWYRPLSELTTGAINPQPHINSQKSLGFKLTAPAKSNHLAVISFSFLNSDQITVKIFNLSGHEIATFVNKNLGPGSYSLNWDTKNIAAGCYTVRMQTGTNTYVRSVPIF